MKKVTSTQKRIHSLRNQNGNKQKSVQFESQKIISNYKKDYNKLLQNLEAEKQKFIDIFEHASSFMIVLRGKKHVFEMVNNAYYKLAGYRDFLGKTVLEAMPEMKEQGFVNILDTVLATGEPFIGTEMKVFLQRKPQAPIEERYVNFVYEALRSAGGKRVGILVHGYDVTDQVVARQKVERQALVFDTSLSSIKDFIYTFDTSGKFVYANTPLLHLLGITLEEIVGKDFYELPYPNEMANILQTQITNVITTGKSITDETQYTNPTGYVGYYEYIFMPVFDNGEVVLVAGSTRDITNRKDLERQKDEFLSMASHELRTPVTSIKGYAQLLHILFTEAGDITAAELVLKLDKQVDNLTTLIANLFDDTRVKEGKLELHKNYFDLNDIVLDVIEEVQHTTKKHKITYVIAKVANIYGDKDRIRQVIINLLTNAVKYSPNTTHIEVVTKISGKKIFFSVQDFGVGINKKDQLLVSNCQLKIKKMTDIMHHKKNKTVMITDDNQGILDAMKLMLEYAGYEVVTTADGNDLLDLKDPLPNLLFLDLLLSGTNGSDLCRHIKNNPRTKHLPIIILSANGDISEISTASGADGFLTKPFCMKDMLAIVERYSM